MCPVRSTSRSPDNSPLGQARFWTCRRPVLISETAEQLSEARLRLARVGIEAERGYLKGGIAGWKQAGFELAQLPQLTVEELQRRLSGNRIHWTSAGNRNGWPGNLRERSGGHSIASASLPRRLISLSRWRFIARADIAACLPAAFCSGRG
jgi:hypothetical protein